MINAHELRLGNKVYGQKDCIFTVLEIMACGITYDCDHQCAAHAEWDELESIPLTSELLERCGFIEECIYGIPQWTHEVGFFFFGPAMGVEEYSVRIQDRFDVMFHNVHQLQNLFFYLTGTELQYTP